MDWNREEAATSFQDFKENSVFVQCIETPSLTPLLGDLKDKRVYDLGCGWGFYARKFQRDFHAGYVLASDISAEMIALARKFENPPTRVDYRVCDAGRIEKENDFDLIFANFLLHFARDDRHLSTIVGAMHSQLKEGGRALGFVPTGDADLIGSCCWSLAKYGFFFRLEKPFYDGCPLEIIFGDKNGRIINQVTAYLHFSSTYERVFREAGFAHFRWIEPSVSSSGIDQFGADFWSDLMQPKPRIVIFEAIK